MIKHLEIYLHFGTWVHAGKCTSIRILRDKKEKIGTKENRGGVI